MQEHGERPSWMLLLLEITLGKRCYVVPLVVSSPPSVWYPAPHGVLGTVLPCMVWGQACSPSLWEAGDQCAGLGFLDDSCAVPQLCLRGQIFCTQNYYSLSFSAKGLRVTKLRLNLSMGKPLGAKSCPFRHGMSQCFRHQ